MEKLTCTIFYKIILVLFLTSHFMCNAQEKFNKGIPNKAHQRISENIQYGIQSFSFTPNGGWALITNQNKFYYDNIPSECISRVRDFIKKGHKVINIAFPPKGGNSWVVLTDKSMFARNIPNESYLKLKEYYKKGVKPISIVYPRKRTTDNSWLIITEKGGFSAKHIDDECFQILRNLSESDMPNKRPARKITHVSFRSNGNWLVIADDYHFTKNYKTDWASKMNSFRMKNRKIKLVAFTPNGQGWSIISNQKSINKPVDRIRNFENNVANKSIWQRMNDLNVPGVSVGVVINGKLAWSTGYGFLRQDDRKYAVHPETMFQAASISKVVAAIGAFKLKDQKKISLTENLLLSGKLNWSDPFHSCAKNQRWRTNFTHITVSKILNHKSGIEGRGSVFNNNCQYRGPNSNGNMPGGGFGGYRLGAQVPKLSAIMNTVKITYDPANGPNAGSTWYSGKAFTLLQKLTIDVTKRTYPDWMKEHVLSPLEMKQSRFTYRPEKYYKKEDLTFGFYTNTNKHVRNSYPQYAAAGLYTNAKELSNVLIMLNNRGTFKRRTVLSSHSAISLRMGNGINISRGPRSLKSKKYYYHGGTNEGYRAYFIGLPSLSGNEDNIKSAGIVILTNGDDTGFRGELVNAVIRAYDW